MSLLSAVFLFQHLAHRYYVIDRGIAYSGARLFLRVFQVADIYFRPV